MGERDYARIKRQLEIDKLRTFARIEEAEDGGPIIDLMTGREPHTVGQKTCIKAAMWALPWESFKAELKMIELCEVASPVKAIMSQPHELFMKIIGEPNEWMYRPDLRLSVDDAVVDTMASGVPFWQAVVEWTPDHRAGFDRTLIVEVKDDDDPRLDDPIYERKLELARQVYEFKGWRFATVIRSEDIVEDSIACSVRNLMLDHDTSLSPADIDRARGALEPGGRGSLGDVAAALGSAGMAKCAALHVRRLISIDLRHDLKPDTPVVRMPDDMAIFEMKGRVIW